VIVGDLDEIQYDLEVDGEQVRRQISRRIWAQRGWATVLVLFEEKKGDAWIGKLAIYRMKKKGDGWAKHALVTVPGDVATGIGEELAKHALAGDDDDE
jgi:hypothetical protein